MLIILAQDIDSSFDIKAFSLEIRYQVILANELMALKFLQLLLKYIQPSVFTYKIINGKIIHFLLTNATAYIIHNGNISHYGG